MPRRACHFLPGKVKESRTSDGFLGTSRLATPELFKGGPMCQSIKMMFFYGVHHCYITVSYTLSGHEPPMEPKLSSGLSLCPQKPCTISHMQCATIPLLSPEHKCPLPLKTGFQKTTGAFLGTLQETYPPTLLLFLFPSPSVFVMIL